jgi:predicted AlkP superfamily phosphohydrolase/phosphomutase
VLAVLQFDAVSVPLVERLASEGRMPAFAELQARGRWRDLESPATHFPAGSYASLYSGLEIADHGMYYSFQWSPTEQRLRWRGTFPQPRMIWERVAAAGKRALVVDPYECEPPRECNGIVLAGWQLINVMSLPRWSAPASAQRELAGIFGRPQHVNEVFGQPTVRGLLALRKRLLAATRRVAEVAVHQLERDRYDFVWVNFLTGHLGGHMFWNLSQIDAEQLDGETHRTLERALEDIYVEMDRGLGRVVAALPDADLIVTAPMGMGANMSRVDLLPGMLEAVLGANGSAPVKGVESRTERFLWALRAAIPTSARAKVATALHGPLTRELTMRLSSFGVDWARTPAFMLPSDHFGQIRLNVRGREREGIVDPAGVDDLVEEIRSGLLSFRDPDGEPSVVAVDRVADVLGDGKRAGSLPDLVVRWSDRPSTGVTHVTSTDHRTVHRPGQGTGRSGAHRPEAWALVVPTASVETQTEAPRLVDIAATVCAVVGADAAGLPGSPLLVRGESRG